MGRWMSMAVAAAVAVSLSGVTQGRALAADAAKSAPRTVVLDTAGFWRLHQKLAPPVIETPDGPKTILAAGQKWLQEETADAAGGWRLPDFDDHRWVRGPLRSACAAPMLSRLCIRGKFLVTDPSKVRDLRLSVGYYGGAIVYVNGREVARGHLGPGEKGRLGSAETYAEDMYFFGNIETWDYLTGGPADAMDRKRTRRLDNIAVPPALLRKGLNVVALEIVRPREHPCVEQGSAHKRRTPYLLNWAACAARDCQLTADGLDGLVPNAVRPAGLQAWNSSLLSNDFAVDFGDATEKLRPVEIVGARNGSFSGKVVVGADRALEQFRAVMSDLKGPGTIPSSAVRLRYAAPWAEEGEDIGEYAVDPILLGALEETPPTEIPVRKSERTWRSMKSPSSPPPVFGAVVPVWVTADVPAGAPAGSYSGTLTVRANGFDPLTVPVRLTVEDWTLPAPQDYRTWVEMIESPDTLALEYGLVPWSDRHFAMIAQAMRHLNRIGSRILYVPLICRTNLGNDESMVRWIKKPDGTWGWDFSIMDRYLDTAERSMGRPKIVCFWAWDKFMFGDAEDPRTFEEYRPGARPERVTDVPSEYIGRGPRVTVIDPATGRTHAEQLPHILDPASRGIWRPLFDALGARMEKRGLAGAMMLGTPSDVVLRKDHFAFYNAVAPGVPWVNHSHFDVTRIYEVGGARLGYCSTVIDVLFPGYPEDGRHYGWKRAELHAHLRSRWGRDFFPLTTWRHVAEINITGEQRGVGRLGADFWKAVKDKRGNRVGRVFDRFPECGWRSNDLCSSLLAPGKDGPVATVRYEMAREGVQECEARIFIERALTDDALRARLGDDLAKRCRDALDERLRFIIKGMNNLNLDGYIAGQAGNATCSWWNTVTLDGHKWFVGSLWEERSQGLFHLAGEADQELPRTPP